VAVVAALALSIAALPAQAQVAPAGEIGPIAAAGQQAPQQDQPAQTTGQGGKKDSGGGVPIWAGIGLILLAAAAGSLAARARNRRRMRDYTGE
jgi:hypothetical protein